MVGRLLKEAEVADLLGIAPAVPWTGNPGGTMDPLEFVLALVGAIVSLALIAAIFRMDQTTRAILFELQKVSAAVLLVHDLVEGPKVKGRPRIVRAKDHQPLASGA